MSGSEYEFSIILEVISFKYFLITVLSLLPVKVHSFNCTVFLYFHSKAGTALLCTVSYSLNIHQRVFESKIITTFKWP
jgi:hypothetical protein